MGKSFHFFRVSKQLFIFLKGGRQPESRILTARTQSFREETSSVLHSTCILTVSQCHLCAEASLRQFHKEEGSLRSFAIS